MTVGSSQAVPGQTSEPSDLWMLIEKPKADLDHDMKPAEGPEITKIEKLRCRLHVLSYAWLSLL